MGILHGSGRGAPCAAGARGLEREEDGLFGAPPVTVIAGEESTSSVLKAIAMLGLGVVAS